MNKDTEQELKELKALTMNIFGRIEKLIEGGVKEVIRKADKVYDKHMGNQTYISDVKSPFESKGAKSNKVTVFTRTSDGFPASSFIYDILENGDIVAYNPSIEWVRAKIEEVGSKIGSVHFYKRSSGELRKMCFRLHVQNPSVVKKPSSPSFKHCKDCNSKSCKNSSEFDKVAIAEMYKRQAINNNNDQMTVYDCNKVVRDKNGVVIGRGDYRTIPLDRVVRIVSNGKTYKIERADMIDVG
jgi:hypothetical protein